MKVKRIATVAACLLPAICFADWISDFPTAYTLQPFEYKINYSISNDSFEDKLDINVGILPFLEAYVSHSDRTNLSLQYSVSQPYPEVAPGIAIGVFDITNQPEIYVALTFQFNVVANWAKKERGTFTVGTGTGSFGKSAFVSASVPIFPKVTFITEWFSKSQMFGLDFEPVKGFAFRGLIRDQLPQFSIQFRRLF